MPATSLDLSQIKTDALASASSFRSLIGLGTLATQSATITDYLTIASAASTYQPLDSDLTSIAALSTTAFGRGLLTEVSATTARSTLGLGTLSTQSPTGTPSASTFLRGDYSWQTIDLSGYVPYTGATGAVNLGSNAFTASQATLSAGTLNGTVLDISQTWGGTGTYTGIKYNVTDSGPANAASLLMDLQVGGTSRLQLDKSNNFRIGVTSSFAPFHLKTLSSSAFFAIQPGIGSTSGIYFGDSSGDFTHRILKQGFDQDYTVVGTMSFRTGSPSTNRFSIDGNGLAVFTGTVEQRNSTNAQTFRIYNLFTDASNYERAKVAWESNVLVIGTEALGTGSNRNVRLQSSANTLTLDTSGYLTMNASLFFSWSARTTLGAPSAGVLRLVDDGGGSNPRIVFQGTTSSFPAIKRNAAAINFRLADDSGDCDITAKAATFSGNVTVSAVNIVTDTTTGTKIGTATTQKLGFYNATPVVQPAAVADATDAASVITQLNALLSRMRDLGLIAT